MRLTATAGRIQNKKVERVFLPMFRVTVLGNSVDAYQSILYLPTSSTLNLHNAVVSAESKAEIIAENQLRLWLSEQNPEHKVLLLSQKAFSLIDSSPEKALELLQRTKTLQPESAMVHYNIGCVLAALGKLSEAELAFSQAIALDDRMPEAFFNRAVAALLQSNNVKAISDLSKAGELGLYRAYSLIKQAQKQQTK